MKDKKSLFSIHKQKLCTGNGYMKKLSCKEFWGIEASRIRCDIKILFSRVSHEAGLVGYQAKVGLSPGFSVSRQ